mmetsp:Transcript_5395/g.7574  ORF Transcript_5395/g.7574 Transcript_5395/m.7574 type:complete len:613 (+) Transcript_5395:200-2038(+)
MKIILAVLLFVAFVRCDEFAVPPPLGDPAGMKNWCSQCLTACTLFTEADLPGCYTHCTYCGTGPSKPDLTPQPYLTIDDPGCTAGYVPTPQLSPVVGFNQTKKNVIVFLVDDLDEMISPYFQAMPFAKQLFQVQGTKFSNAMSSTSVCCAARCQLLTGLYGHNVGVLANAGRYGGLEAFMKPYDQNGQRLKDRQGRCYNYEYLTLPLMLTQAGYKNAIFGKYLNGYENDTTHVANFQIPPGWDRFVVGSNHGYYAGYNFVLADWQASSNNLTYEWHGIAPEDYFTDVMRDKVVDYINHLKNTSSTDPYFMYVAVSAPHFPVGAAPRHRYTHDYWRPQFSNFVSNRANYNGSVAGRPTWLQQQAPLRDKWMNTTWNQVDFVRRMGSLYAVDDLIQAVYTAVLNKGDLSNTVFVLASDNGYNFGAHKLIHKMTPYEEAIRVPLYFSGGGVQAGRVVDSPVILQDIAPTVLELAGLNAPTYMDGRSLVNELTGGTAPRRLRSDIFLQYKVFWDGEDPNSVQTETVAAFSDLPPAFALDIPPFKGVRTPNYLMVEWPMRLNGTNGQNITQYEYEVYNMNQDPAQMNNIASTMPPAIFNVLLSKLHSLASCSGPSCL